MKKGVQNFYIEREGFFKNPFTLYVNIIRKTY